MARTILAIAQEAAERYNTAPAPDKLFGTNNRIAKILRAAAADTIQEYIRTAHWQGMSELHSTWAFTTVAGRYAYPLPPDFKRTIPRTEQREGWPMGLVGPAHPATWAAWVTGMAASVAPMGWRIRNNALWLEPPPAAEELVTIDYVSRYPVVSLINDDDIDNTRVPAEVIAPLVPRDGFLAINTDIGVPSDDDALYGGAQGYGQGTYGSDIFNELRRIAPSSTLAPLPQVRRPAFTADTDMPAFEDDHFLSLGMTMRLRIGLGLDYAEVGAEYEAEMEVKQSSDAGTGRPIRIGCDDDYQIEAIPLGGTNWLVG
jgi:hypothetical protein